MSVARLAVWRLACCSRAWAALLGVLAAGSVAAQHEAPVVSLQALSVAEPIEVDGRLDEEVWARAPVASEFTQREPQLGQPATELTEVRVVYTPTTLYVGIYCFDSDPQAIVDREMQRDGPLFRDDSIILVVDTFHDHRNGYFLETNPNGAILDALITDERDLNSDWDGVWTAASRIVADGWTTEMAIPFATLRFEPGLETWGFNVRRLIARKREQAYWAQVGRDANLLRMSRAGHLTGLAGIEPGLNLRLKPFLVGNSSDFSGAAAPSSGEDLEAGLDVKWAISRGVALDLTYNTDFAEAEADDQQVNLTRFSLFLDEKRDFFLENAGIFELVPPSLLGGTPLLKPFFSRRIGIGPNGQQVPILGGARLTGRSGGWNFGLLDVATEEVPGQGGRGPIPEDNWGVVRVKRNVGDRSTVGMILTNRQQEGGGYNRVMGLDANLNPLRKLNVNTYYVASDDPGSGGDDWAGGAAVSWSGQDWIWGLELAEIGERFNPEAGFLLRQGVRRYAPILTWQPRPAIPRLRNLVFGVQGEMFTVSDRGDEIETIAGRIDLFGFVLKSEDEMRLLTDLNRERLFAPFQIQPGVIIPAGDYRFQDFGIEYSTTPTRSVFVNGQILRGDFYDGERFANIVNLGWRPNRYFFTVTRWSRDEVDLPGGSFTTDVVRQRLSVSLSPTLFSNAFLQYNEAAELLSLNLRFNWIYRPGADLFLVFNQNWNAPGVSDLDRRESQVILKFTYLLEL